MNNSIVKCYSGYTYAERPKSFLWQDTVYEIQEIEKEWREPGRKRFRVRTEDGKRFELCYDTQTDKWSVTEFI